jgi:hypothetical protein
MARARGPKRELDLRALARSHTAMGVRVLAKIANDDTVAAQSRVAAIGLLFQRGWGNPRTEDAPVGSAGEGGERIVVEIMHNVVRQIEATPELEAIEQGPQVWNGK